MGSTRKFKRKYKKKDESKDERKPYQEIVKENVDFQKYYKAQGLVGEVEWEQVMEALRSDLPTTFRIMGAWSSESKKLLEVVRGQYFKALVNAEQDPDDQVPSKSKEPFCLPWYPNKLGWQLELSRKDIRRSESYWRLHNFLISETACGAISRQEAVSMIPPLLLDIQPHHKVFDMCAAPGSKTAQLIELLHSGDSSPPSGIVIANDIDNSRCYMLVHQAKRLNSPCIVITNHDSASMPNLVTKNSGGEEKLKFDRVLCDVPCCGDGTLRKNPDIWGKWNPANGNNLHGIQYRILRRGLDLLKEGGRLVYSTCSLNPVENEAVIVRILSEAKGGVELMDVKDSLPGLKIRPGLSSWLPASKDLTLYKKFEEVEEKWQTQVRPSMFPPEPEEASKYHLERCMRILPHDQDTGGFFVSVLEKKHAVGWEKGGGDEVPEPPQEVRKEPLRKRRRIQGYREDPYFFLTEDDPVWVSIREFYGIEGLAGDCLLTRCATGKKKNIYYVTPEVRDIIINNQSSIKIINTGVKVFSRCDNKAMGCSFRLVQEGLESVRNYIGQARRVEVSREEMVAMLERNDPTHPLPTEELSKKTQSRLASISSGSCILDMTEEPQLTLVGWKGNKSIRAYISQHDTIHYLRLLSADVSKLEVNKFKKVEPRVVIKAESNSSAEEEMEEAKEEEKEVEGIKKEIKVESEN